MSNSLDTVSAEATAQRALDAAPAVKNQFVLILQDNPETGALDVAGTQAPAEFIETSPAHIVGRFIQENLEAIVAAAANEASKRLGVAALANDSEAVSS